VSYTDTPANNLAAGIYNAYHVNYPGNTVGTTTWSPTDSRLTPLADQAFQILPVSILTTEEHTLLTHALRRN
jgi:hypothetical protein